MLRMLSLRRNDIVRILAATRSAKARDAGYDDIEDLVQDTIIRALGREGTPAAFDPARSSWVTWIVRVADDCIRTSWRRQRASRQGIAHMTYEQMAS